METLLTPVQMETKNKLSDPVISCNRDLRFVLTQDCNYQCAFCHKERMDGNERELFDNKDYWFIYKTVKDAIPLQGVTLTGGEPLTRTDIRNILQELRDENAFITMVTNGALLRHRPDIPAYLDRLNISLHTTNQEIYETITHTKSRVKNIMEEIKNIRKKYPHLDLRINSTFVEHSTATPKEINNMLDFVKNNSLTIKILELAPKTAPGYISSQSIIPLLEKKGFERIKDERNESVYSDGNAKVMLRKLMCSLVEDNNLNQNYCKQNADINVSPDGKISPCLYDQKKFSIYEQVKMRDAKNLAKTFQDATSTTEYNCCV